MAKKIFVGSSIAAKRQATLFIEGCATGGVQFLPWWEQFTAGRTLLGELDRIKQGIDAAVLLLTHESDSTIRGNTVLMPNLNVLFEFGYFYNALGKDRVAVVKYGRVYLPSDLDGYIHIFGSEGLFRRGYGQVVGVRTKREFEQWLNAF